MYRPQKLVAVLFSAALLCTTGMALADRGGNHGNPHGGPPGQSGQGPGQSSSAPGQSSLRAGPGGMQEPASLPGQNSPQGRAFGFQGNVTGTQGATIDLSLPGGAAQAFRVSSAVAAAVKAHARKTSLIFFTTNGSEITAVSFPGEKSNMRVVSQSGGIFTLQSADGQSRLIALDAKTVARLHVRVGSNLQITTDSANGGKVVALDLIKAHQFDKFSPGRGTAASRQAAQLARMNAAGRTPPGLPHQCINPAGNTRGWCKSGHDVDVAKGDIDQKKFDVDTKSKKTKKSKSDRDVADVDTGGGRGKCGPGSSRNGNPAFANQMAKDAANDASGHNPPGLPHECVNPAGHTRGFCKSASSESVCGSGSGAGGGGENQVASNGSQGCPPGTKSRDRSNPAFANQMAKDAANDLSGHNPPGLPHECVNPAGHTRGFCKSRSSESSALCGSAVASTGGGSNAVAGSASGGGATPLNTHGGIAASNALGSGERGPGSPVGFVPAGGGSFASGSGTRGVSSARPTHVLGAAVGPTGGRRVAALPTRVLPVAIQPVGKRRCVWYKTAVLGASMGPRIIGTSATSGKPVLHKKCK